MMDNLATGRVDAAIAYAPTSTYLQVCQCRLRAGDCLRLVGEDANAMLKRMGIRTCMHAQYRSCIVHAYMFVCTMRFSMVFASSPAGRRQSPARSMWFCTHQAIRLRCTHDGLHRSRFTEQRRTHQSRCIDTSPVAVYPLALAFKGCGHCFDTSETEVLPLAAASFLWGHVCVGLDRQVFLGQT